MVGPSGRAIAAPSADASSWESTSAAVSRSPILTVTSTRSPTCSTIAVPPSRGTVRVCTSSSSSVRSAAVAAPSIAAPIRAACSSGTAHSASGAPMVSSRACSRASRAHPAYSMYSPPIIPVTCTPPGVLWTMTCDPSGNLTCSCVVSGALVSLCMAMPPYHVLPTPADVHCIGRALFVWRHLNDLAPDPKVLGVSSAYHSTMTTRSAGIYARISLDDGTALGVGRQVDDCAAEADRRGWTLVDQYIDNNVSATKKKPRPEYERMISDIEAGRIDAVIVWDVDRLTRRPAELETFIDLADRHGLALASVGGEIDLASPQGRLTARIKGSVARHEAEQMGRRLARKAEETARAGFSTVGPAPFGYERRVVPRDGGNLRMLVPLEGEARWMRDAYRRLLAGDTLRQISLDMAAAGVRGKRGDTIRGSMLGNMMRRPVYAGIRVYKGERLGPGEWEPLVSMETFDQAQAILNAPGRFHTRGTAPKYLLSRSE